MASFVVPASVKPAVAAPVPAPAFSECGAVGAAWTDAFAVLQGSAGYKNWAKANPGELAKFSAAFPASSVSLWPLQGPSLVTAFGRALVGFANMRARACHA